MTYYNLIKLAEKQSNQSKEDKLPTASHAARSLAKNHSGKIALGTLGYAGLRLHKGFNDANPSSAKLNKQMGAIYGALSLPFAAIALKQRLTEHK